MTKVVNSEQDVCERFSKYLSTHHPELAGLWHWDTGSGIKLSKGQAAKLKRLNHHRGWPDFILLYPRFYPNTITISGLKEGKE